METERRSPSAYGGLGPTDLNTGYIVISVTTVLILLRIYVRYAITPHGGVALAWACLAWVSDGGRLSGLLQWDLLQEWKMQKDFLFFARGIFNVETTFLKLYHGLDYSFPRVPPSLSKSPSRPQTWP